MFRKLEILTDVPQLKPLVESWQRSERHHAFDNGVDDEDIKAVEYELGLAFPDVFRALYRMSDGMGLVGSNVCFAPMDMGEDELSVLNYSRKLRSWEWEIPDEVVVFGSDGSDGTYGLWLPEGSPRKTDCPIVEIGEGSGLALIGTNLCSFLTWKTAYYLLLEDGPSEALDALRLPDDLRIEYVNDDQYARLIRWADPDIPDPLADPYERPDTVEEIRARFGA